MIVKLKLYAYGVLLILAVWFGWKFYSSYALVGPVAAGQPTNAAAPAVVALAPKTNQPESAPAPTNRAESLTNMAGATHEGAGSNLVPQPAAAASANASVTATVPPVPAPASVPVRQGRLVGYLAAFVGTMIGLGLLVAYDLTHYAGGRAIDFLFNDEGEGMRDPEYERAEATWANGNYLEAIELMREYLKKNPREQYVALRIAEIYEKDMHNYLAAALEYEEILKKKLPDERWGWAAIHLCNLYSRMGQPDKMKALLERIAKDHPKTAAAKKARRNLGVAEPEPEPAAETAEKAAEEPDDSRGTVFNLDEAIAATEGEDAIPLADPPPAAASPSAVADPKPHLPPGFRPKKG